MSATNAPSLLDPTTLASLLEEPLRLEERDDLSTLVQNLPAMPFVRIARRLEEEGRLDLLIPYARGEQLSHLMDLEVWSKDRVDIPSARQWLLTIAEQRLAASHLPRGALGDLMYQMDPEMWTFALYHLSAVGVVDPEDEQSRLEILNDMQALITYETPDGLFVVGAPDQSFGRQALRLLEYIYKDDLAEGRKLVLSIHNALPSQIEEQLHRWRRGRLSDLGFPERDDAMQIFVPLPVAKLAQNSDTPRFIPDYLESRVGLFERGDRLLTRVMGRLDDAEHHIRSREFLLLANEWIVAQGLAPGDEKAQAQAINCTAATLNLGLEHYCAAQAKGSTPSLDDLAALVQRIGLRSLFRVGYGPLAKVRKACQTLRRGSPISGNGLYQLLDRPWGAAAQSLGALYPMLPAKEPKAGENKPGPASALLPIAELEDLAVATRMLRECASLLRIAFDPRGLHIDPVWIARTDEVERLRLGDLIRSGLLLRLRDPQRPFMPLSPEDLKWAQEHALAEGRPAPSLQTLWDQLCVSVEAQDDQVQLQQNLLTRFSVELAALEHNEKGEIALERAGGFFTLQQVAIWLKTGLNSLERDQSSSGSSSNLN